MAKCMPLREGMMHYVVWGLALVLLVNISFVLGFCLGRCFRAGAYADSLGHERVDPEIRTESLHPHSAPTF